MKCFFYYNCSAYGNNCVPILLWWVFAYHAFWNSSYEFLRACCFSPSHKKDLLVGPVMILEMNNQSIRAPLTLGHIIISTVADDNDENDKMLWRQKRSVFLWQWHDVNVFLPSPIACSSQCGNCAIGHHLSAWIVKIKTSMNIIIVIDRHRHRTCVTPESWCVQFRGWGEDRDGQSRVQHQKNDHPAVIKCYSLAFQHFAFKHVALIAHVHILYGAGQRNCNTLTKCHSCKMCSKVLCNLCGIYFLVKQMFLKLLVVL